MRCTLIGCSALIMASWLCQSVASWLWVASIGRSVGACILSSSISAGVLSVGSGDAVALIGSAASLGMLSRLVKVRDKVVGRWVDCVAVSADTSIKS
ncbi:hypothetical protein ACGTJS_04460 [Faucicola mancuniensis]|uniref:hypothetical protein n=1 Tax=Faucicola mancuniensis TaxID=1309795 RepID=UPI00397744DD